MFNVVPPKQWWLEDDAFVLGRSLFKGYVKLRGGTSTCLEKTSRTKHLKAPPPKKKITGSTCLTKIFGIILPKTKHLSSINGPSPPAVLCRGCDVKPTASGISGEGIFLLPGDFWAENGTVVEVSAGPCGQTKIGQFRLLPSLKLCNIVRQKVPSHY